MSSALPVAFTPAEHDEYEGSQNSIVFVHFWNETPWEAGPTFGPFDNANAYLEISGSCIQHGLGLIALLATDTWVLSDLTGEYAGQRYSEVTITAHGDT